jgi:hypothetical protein
MSKDLLNNDISHHSCLNNQYGLKDYNIRP